MTIISLLDDSESAEDRKKGWDVPHRSTHPHPHSCLPSQKRERERKGKRKRESERIFP
jgi:hypothetical protein